MNKKERKNRLISLGIWAGGIAAVLLLLFLVRLNFGSYITQFFAALNSILVPISFSIFVVYLIKPINNWLIVKTGRKRLSAVVAIILFFLMVVLFLGVLYFMVADQLSQVLVVVEANWTSIVERAEYLVVLLPESIKEQIFNPSTGVIEFDRTMSFLLSQIDVGSLVGSLLMQSIRIAAVLIDLSIIVPLTPIFMYFFLVDGQKIFDFIISYIPRKLFREEIQSVLVIANDSTGKYMRGKLISIAFLIVFFGVSFSAVFIAFGKLTIADAIIYGFIFAAIMGVLDLIPFIGPFIGFLLPLFFIAILSSSILEFVIFAGFLTLANTTGQNAQKTLIEPVIMSKEVKIHPLAVLMGILFFGALFGFVGFILATPLVATIHTARNYFLERYERENKETEEVSVPQEANKEV
jgi:putative permease